MTKFIGWIIVPDELVDEDDQQVLSKSYSKDIIEELLEIFRNRISNFHVNSHNGYHVVNFSDFSNHAFHSRRVFLELRSLALREHSHLEVNIQLFDSEYFKFEQLCIGDLFSAFLPE